MDIPARKISPSSLASCGFEMSPPTSCSASSCSRRASASLRNLSMESCSDRSRSAVFSICGDRGVCTMTWVSSCDAIRMRDVRMANGCKPEAVLMSSSCASTYTGNFRESQGLGDGERTLGGQRPWCFQVSATASRLTDTFSLLPSRSIFRGIRPQ